MTSYNKLLNHDGVVSTDLMVSSYMSCCYRYYINALYFMMLEICCNMQEENQHGHG